MRTPCLATLALLLTGCARTLFGSGEPFQPWAVAAEGVAIEERADDTVVFRPTDAVAPARVLLFLHGFASRPAQYHFTLEHLAARGFVVFAPTLPDYFIGRIGFHGSVLAAAMAAYDDALAEATLRGAPPPVVVGYSLGGGAAVHVGAAHGVPTVLWAPVRLDRDLPAVTSPMLMLIADHDCIAKDQPSALATELGAAVERITMLGNHVGFTDLSGAERFDCPSPVTRNAQREDAVQRTVAFFDAHR